jgi:GTP-binding nuclear protein Ran
LVGSVPFSIIVEIAAHYLARSNPTLEFVAAPALAPAEVSVDPALMAQYEAELKNVSHYRVSIRRSPVCSFSTQAEAVPLPEDDEDL